MQTTKALVLATALGLAGAPSGPADADDDDKGQRRIVTVAFGAGLNTAQPGNPDNHHVIPDVIRIGVGDVVSFVVSGLHVIRVYDDGVRLADVKNQIPDECEMNPVPPDLMQCQFGAEPPEPPVIPEFDLPVYYRGIDPLGDPPPANVPPFALPSTAVNRVEGVSFLEPGRYLVICAILPHFNDRMLAWVEVRGGGGGNDQDRGNWRH